MGYKSQLFSVSGTDDALPLRDWRNALAAKGEDTRFFRSWLVCDFNVTPGLDLPRIHWHKVLGLLLAIAVSGGVWAGTGLLIAQFWK